MMRLNRNRKDFGQKNARNSAVVASLRACAHAKDLCKGSLIHADIISHDFLGKDIYVCCALVNMYAKCSALEKAQEVFDQFPSRNVFTWTALIAGYAQAGEYVSVTSCLTKMQHEGIYPNEITFVCILKTCNNMGATDKGMEMHAEISRSGLLDRSTLVGNALIDMYAKSGALEYAQEVFNSLSAWDVVSWNALISGYVQHNQGDEAIEWFSRMQDEGFSPNEITFVCVLKACGIIKAMNIGEDIHVKLVKEGLLMENVLIGNTLVDMYAKCGAMDKAQQVFELLLHRDVVTWNVLIVGYVESGYGEKALICYERLHSEGLFSNEVTFVCVLKACASVGAWKKGKALHAKFLIEACVKKDILIGNALIDMYGKCGALTDAEKMFKELQHRDVSTWNALITGYIQNQRGAEALSYFQQMKQEGLSPNAVTFACIFKACSTIRALETGKQLHINALRDRRLLKDVLIKNALIDMYAKCADLDKAQEVFDELPVWDVVSLTTLIAGYSQYGYAEEAINCFNQMLHKSILASPVTFACILKACGSVGAIRKGKEIHAQIFKEELNKKDALVDNALIDMYAKCGAVTEAREIFDRLSVKDIVSWTIMLTGYAQIGEDEIVVNLFNEMLEDGIEPNLATFTVVLFSCSHSGLLEKGKMYYETMNVNYGIMPTSEHHTCMVDLFGRAGYFGEAIAVITSMPTFDYLPAWISLLGACQKWGNVKLGRLAYEHAIQLDEKGGSVYVCMSNIYTAAAMQEEAEKVEVMRIKNESWTYSERWMDGSQNINSFLLGRA